MRDKVLLGGIAAGLFLTDLRAPVRKYLSCTDASDEGGGAAEASHFNRHVSRAAEQASEDLKALRLEEAAS